MKLLLFATALNFAAAAATCPVDDPTYFEFDPPTIDIDDGTLISSFRIKLRSNLPLTEPVDVFLRGRGLRFSNCSLKLQKNEWKDVHLSGAPSMKSRKVRSTLRVIGISGNQKIRSVYPVTRQVSPGGTCASTGDPHYRTFGEQTVTDQGRGVYTLFSDKHFQVQALQDTCGTGSWSNPACNKAIAIRYGSSIVTIDVRNGTIFKEISPNRNGIVYEKPDSKDITHNFKLPCGSQVKLVAATHETSFKYINAAIIVAAGYRNTGGLCNRLNDKTGLFYKKDGTGVAASKVKDFFASWKVPDEENLFLGNYIAGNSNPPQVVLQKCRKSKARSLKPIAAPAPKTPSNLERRSVGTTGPVEVVESKDFSTQVNEYCNSLFEKNSCSELVDTSFYIHSCISDALATGSLAFAEGHRFNYNVECSAMTYLMKEDPEEDVVAKAHQAETESGLGNKACINDCSGRGACDVNGCICDAGFGGIDCSNDLTTLISYDSKLDKFVTNTPLKDLGVVGA